MKLPTSIFSTIDFSEETRISPMISRFKARVLYLGENRNGSFFTKEVVDEMVKTMGGIPIVGYYSEDAGDFTSHYGDVKLVRIEDAEDGERQWECLFLDTKPYGFVPTNPVYFWENHLDKDGVVREYLCTEVYLWMGRYPELDVLRAGENNQSMELNPNLSTGYWKVMEDGREIFVFDHAEFSGLCILGKDVEPCFEGAGFTFSKEEDSDSTNLLYALSEMRDELRAALEVYESSDEASDVVEEVSEEPEEYEEVEEEVDANFELEEEVEPTTEELEQIEQEASYEENFEEVSELEVEEVEITAPTVEELIKENKDLLQALNSLQSSFEKVTEELEQLKSSITAAKEKQEKLDYLREMQGDMSEERFNSLMESIDSLTLEELKSKAVLYAYEYLRELKVTTTQKSSYSSDTLTVGTVWTGTIATGTIAGDDWKSTVYRNQMKNK